MSTKKVEEISLGAIRSPYDYRDVPLAAVTAGETVVLPQSYFEKITNLPVWHQRKIGACVGHAAGGYKQNLDYLDTGKVHKLSARFLYALAKCRDGFNGEGTYPRLVAKILKDHGCATEATVPNDTTLDHETYVYNRNESKIPAKAFTEAATFRISGYAFADVKDAQQLMTAIVKGRGGILLMRVGREWYTNKKGQSSWAEGDVVPIRPPKSIISGHEVWLYGYEVEAKTGRVKFYVRNSWSKDWGARGNGWFYHDEYVPYLDECITFVDVPNNNLPPAETFKHSFNTPMALGETSQEVKDLQTALMIEGVFDKTLYAKLLQNNELGYYGRVTAYAVLQFQLKYKVASASELNALKGENVGPKTRLKLNELFA